MIRSITCSTTALALGACVLFLSAAPGCGNTSAPGFVGDGGGGDARPDGGAATGSGGGGARDGAAGAGGGAGGSGGAAGSGGAGGAGGAAANPDAARPDGAPGAGGAGADASSDAATLVCRQDETCASGQECQTACAGAAAATTTFCTCAPSGGNRMTLSCVEIPCNRDAGADARPAVAACPNGIRNEDDCNSGNDTICATPCTNQMQVRCVCTPRGGGGGARWMCGAATACAP